MIRAEYHPITIALNRSIAAFDCPMQTGYILKGFKLAQLRLARLIATMPTPTKVVQ